MRITLRKRVLGRASSGFWPYVGIAAVLAVAFALLNGQPADSIKIGMTVILVALGVLIAIWYAQKRLGGFRLLAVILAAGLVLRIGYMLYTPFTLRGHDIGEINGYQNAAYIANLFLYGRLPSSNAGLFYHPPVAFALDAFVMHLYAFFTPGQGIAQLMEAAKLAPAFASCALLVVCLRLFREMGLPRRAILFAMGILAFQPTFFILSSSVNNDMLTIFWMAASLLYTVKWYKNRSMRNILVLAVLIALAITTKVSGALVAPLTAAVFCKAFFEQKRNGPIRGLLRQFGVFFVVCLPLGLWYAVRNHVLFGQPFGYVLPMNSNGPLYIGMHSFASRFLAFPFARLFSPLFCNPYGDYNLWVYVVKCSLFGEFTFQNDALFYARPLLVLNLILILFSLAAMVWVLRADDMPRLPRFLLGGLWFLEIGSFLVFNIKYPFGCTMDFRYIVPTLISGAGFLGMAAARLQRRHPVAGRRALPVLGALVGVFAAVSALFYLS